MKRISIILISVFLFSCQNSENYYSIKDLHQLSGFWKSGTNLIEINANDSSLTFNNLKKHSLNVEIIDSNFILLGENMYGDESFNGLVTINKEGNKIAVKRSDNHYKYLVGSKTIYERVLKVN
tara:strand:+ start:352 stop:720 length:369 start_codon:yes stop_codon:yes gene_type:complete